MSITSSIVNYAEVQIPQTQVLTYLMPALFGGIPCKGNGTKLQEDK